jgi:hypothetical protein
MKNVLIIVLLVLIGRGSSHAQEQKKDQPPQETPKLEIPEITIVGKKAITLPFARKGEIYDVNVYTLPPPDSSILGVPPSVSLLGGRLPRHENRDDPWRTSVDGALGSFGSGHVEGYLDYKGDIWSLNANGGYVRSNGHVENSSLSGYDLGGSLHSIVATDNPILKSFKADAGASFKRAEYGMFGIPDISARRTHSDFGLLVGVGSLNRTGSVFDLDFTTRFNSVSDTRAAGDSSASAVSPAVRAMFEFPVKRISFRTKFTYVSSSLTYSRPTSAPYIVGLDAGASWKGGERWLFELGGKVYGGSDIHGGDLSLYLPYASAEYAFDSLTRGRVWYNPALSLAPYYERIEGIPYASREIDLRPERKPVVIGGTFEVRRQALAFALTGDYQWYTSKAITVASGGEIGLEYAEATMTSLEATGSLRHWNDSRLELSATLTSAHEQGSGSQLPMVPQFRLLGREEVTISKPLALWGSAEYQSSRYADRAATDKLESFVLVNAGAHFTVARRVVLGAEVTNLLDVGYEWWKGYAAPGIGFNVSASIRIQ